MKKLIVIALSVMMLFAFTACNNATPEPVSLDTITGYFNNFSTDHVLNMVSNAVDGDYSDTQGITRMTTTYVASETAGEDKVEAVLDVKDFRFNGEIEASPENFRSATGTITVTLTGDLEGTAFTAKKWAFTGTGVNMNDSSDVAEAEKLESITVDISLNGEFGTAPSVTIEQGKVTAMANNNADFNFGAADGTITCNKISFKITDLII